MKHLRLIIFLSIAVFGIQFLYALTTSTQNAPNSCCLSLDVIVNAISTLLMAISILLAVIDLKSTNKRFIKQNQIAFFAEYTKRYNDIIISMPDNVFNGSATVEQSIRYLQLYFDLCSEEYHLKKQGFIPEDVWELWKEGMQITTNKRLYKDCWDNIKGIYNQDFYLFFERDILKTR